MPYHTPPHPFPVDRSPQFQIPSVGHSHENPPKYAARWCHNTAALLTLPKYLHASILWHTNTHTPHKYQRPHCQDVTPPVVPCDHHYQPQTPFYNLFEAHQTKTTQTHPKPNTPPSHIPNWHHATPSLHSDHPHEAPTSHLVDPSVWHTNQ